MKNKKGFTLVELLAVIVILAIILVIAVPKVMSIIEDSKAAAIETTVKTIINSAEKKYIENNMLGKNTEITCEDVAKINSEDYKYCNLSFDESGNAKVTLVGNGKLESYYVCNGTKNKIKINDSICDAPIPIEVLQSIVKFSYYSTLGKALDDINNNDIGKNADVTKEDAVAGAYIYNNEKFAVLLKDSVENKRVTINSDVTLNLGGKTLTINDAVAIDLYSTNADRVVIDGRIEGSTVIGNGNSSASRVLQMNTEKVIIKGGTYIGYEPYIEEKHSIVGTYTYDNCDLEVYDSVFKIYSKESLVSGSLYGIYSPTNTKTLISNVNIEVYVDINLDLLGTNKIYGYGINNKGTLKVEKSNIKAYSDSYTNIYSYGILNSGKAVINNSYINGVYAGVQNTGEIYSNDNVLEGHITVVGLENDSKSYFQKTIFRNVDAPEGYLSNDRYTKSSIYFSNSNETNKSIAYVDNCDLYSEIYNITFYPYGGTDELYISNSRLYGKKQISLSASNGNVYIGKGNNFTSKACIPALNNVFTTDEEYIYNPNM